MLKSPKTRVDHGQFPGGAPTSDKRTGADGGRPPIAPGRVQKPVSGTTNARTVSAAVATTKQGRKTTGGAGDPSVKS